jgi:hypothetical protein
MKKIKLISILLSLFIGTMIMYSCVDDNFDTPPSDPITVGDVKTISELKALYVTNGDYSFVDDVTVYGTVTMDDKSGNIYKTAYIQDATDAIALHLDASGGIYQGDSIRIQLNGLRVGQYKSLYQIDAIDGNGFNLDTYVTKIKTLVNIEPEVVTISDLTSKQGKLIKLENVQFVKGDTSVTYADAVNDLSLSLTIEDASGSTAIVRTSGFSNFAGELSPSGNGSLIAVVGQYNSDMQLQIRSLDEVIMENDRLGGGSGGAEEGTGTFDDPYNVGSGIVNQGETSVWVEGYLVGVYETVVSPFVASFTAPFTTNSNVIIASTQDETNIANCLVIQVPSGEIRTAVNLMDNATNKGKVVKFKGNLEAYFSGPGLKTVNGYWMDGAGVNPEDPIEAIVIGTSTVVTSLNEDFTGVSADVDFASSGWLGVNVKGERYWQGKNYEGNGYIQATGYGATAAELESWIVTPGIDCSVNKQISFGSKVGYWKHNGLSILISSDFDGNSTNLISSTWTDITSQCTIPTTPTDGYGTDYTPSVVDLSSYTGGTVYVLFKYVGDNSNNTTTYQIDNVQVADL